MSFVRALPVVLLAIIVAGYSSVAHAAGNWADMATVSATMGIHSGQLCIGDAPAGDIGCPTYAPSVTTAGDLIVSGTISARYGYFTYVSATSGLGASALTSLTDVSVSTSPMNGGILTYDSGKWQAVSPSQILSTTTMLPSFPDAIVCVNGTGNNITLYPLNWSSTLITYAHLNNPPTYTVSYNRSNGTYNTNTGLSGQGYDCVDSAYSVSQLYSMGRAFNFIGNNGVSTSSTTLGDRITSGTLVAIANSATGYISLTTNSTNWGYLSSGASYLPNLNTPLVSSTAGGVVSATYGYFKYISGTAANFSSLTVNGVSVTASTSPSSMSAWTDYTSSRALGSTYTNSTGTVLVASITAGATSTGNSVMNCSVDGTSVAYPSIYAPGGGNGYRMQATLLIPPGSTYVCSAGGAAGTTLYSWLEATLSGAGSGGLGVSALASLTDVSVSTNPMSGGILTYASGKWQAVSPSQVLSTTTIYPTFPDAIGCSNGIQMFWLAINQRDLSTGQVTYRFTWNGNTNVYALVYNSDGTYNSNTNMTAFDCATNTYSISQLYSMGRAFNFIGNNGVNTSNTTLGDRITSGTTGIVANSATSVISITTAGVTTGYFTSAGLLVVPGISVTQSYGISSTNGYFSANVGIGTSAPSTTLTVSGTVWGSTYSGLIRTGLAAPTSQTASTVSALNDLSDVTISGASNGEVLSFNGSSWVNSSPASTSPAGNNTEIQFNNSGSFGASSALTWINGSSLLNATNIASSNVSTTDAAVDRVVFNKASATCDASHDGTMRRDPTTGVLQICRH